MILPPPWLFVASQIVLALVCLALAVCFAYLHRRMRIEFWVMATWVPFLLGSAVLHFVLASTHRGNPDPAVALVSAFTAIGGAVAMFFLIGNLRRLAELPSRRQMVEAQRALERANTELEAFTTSVSHDLRSPLTTIAGQAGLLEISAGAKLDDDQRRRLQRIQASVKQMSHLIETLLNLSRISQLELEHENVDISAKAEQILRELAQKEPARSVSIRVKPGLQVRGDPHLLTTVLENLLGNAWKFTSKTPNAAIEVDGAVRDSELLIYVRDNGCGFEMSQYEKLFHPFQRLHAQSEFPGLGIGLATASRIIARHGGRIGAESQPGVGATFWFTVGEMG